MSAILRALQKIEKDTTEDDEQLGPVQPIKPAETISRRLTSLWYLQLGRRFLRIGLGLVLAVLVIFFSITMFRSADRKTLSSTHLQAGEITSKKRVLLSQTEDGNAGANRRGPTRPRSYAPEPTYDPNHQPGRYVSKIPPQTPSPRPSQAFEPQVEPPLETETISPGNGVDDFDDAPAESEEPVKILESDPEELRYAQVALLENEKLELQAISWAKKPSDRIAVINNEIMHQGQFVAGYKIVYIGPDALVVEKGGEQWKIIFMVR